MFGVRMIIFAAMLFGAWAVPLELAEASPHQSAEGFYPQHLRTSLATGHTYARHDSRKSYAKHRVRKSYTRHSTRKTYAYAGRNVTRRSSATPRVSSPSIQVKASARASAGVGPRPARWCGWWMRTQLGGGPELNLARNWKNWGRPSGPQVGAVVVWPHHVGIITGRASNGQWIVKSGNDGGRVRERPRSVTGAVFRVA